MLRPLLLSLVALAACDTEAPSDPFAPVAGELWLDSDEAAADGDPSEAARRVATLWPTCGDPVCSGWRPKGLPRCGPHVAGDRCPRGAVGLECDPVDACNTTLECGFTSPIGSGGCPISRARFKRDIAYLDQAQVETLYGAVRGVKLATWFYKDDPTAAPHTGFVIDDMASGSPAVMADGDHVDLYGYTSMTVAAVQAQARRIDDLEQQLAELRAELVALRKR